MGERFGAYIGFLTTAQCESKITYIDGKNSILRYRGYPIEQLCEKSDFLEVAWLLRHGEDAYALRAGEQQAQMERV